MQETSGVDNKENSNKWNKSLTQEESWLWDEKAGNTHIVTRGKKFLQNTFQVGMDQEKVQKQGRDENTQEVYPTTERWRKRKTKILPAIVS